MRLAGYLMVDDKTGLALEALKARRAELDRLSAKLDTEERNTLVVGEPDARPMGIGKGPKPPSYNLQTAVDADTRQGDQTAERGSDSATLICPTSSVPYNPTALRP